MKSRNIWNKFSIQLFKVSIKYKAIVHIKKKKKERRREKLAAIAVSYFLLFLFCSKRNRLIYESFKQFDENCFLLLVIFLHFDFYIVSIHHTIKHFNYLIMYPAMSWSGSNFFLVALVHNVLQNHILLWILPMILTS